VKYYYPIDIDAAMSVYTGPLTNSHFANDQNIKFAMSGINSGDELRFAFGGSLLSNCAVVYVSSGSGTLTIKRHSSPTTVASQAVSVGWNVITYNIVASSYWNIEFTSSSGLTISEAYIGRIFEFPHNWSLGNTYRHVSGVDSGGEMSGGGEITNKRHGAVWERVFEWQGFSKDHKEEFKLFDLAVDQTRAKFLWFDDTNYHWVKQTQGMTSTQESYCGYNLSSGLREQLF